MIKLNSQKSKIIKDILRKHNSNDKHQQDFIQWQGDIARCLCTGTHGSAPHLTKTLIIIND